MSTPPPEDFEPDFYEPDFQTQFFAAVSAGHQREQEQHEAGLLTQPEAEAAVRRLREGSLDLTDETLRNRLANYLERQERAVAALAGVLGRKLMDDEPEPAVVRALRSHDQSFGCASPEVRLAMSMLAEEVLLVLRDSAPVGGEVVGRLEEEVLSLRAQVRELDGAHARERELTEAVRAARAELASQSARMEQLLTQRYAAEEALERYRSWVKLHLVSSPGCTSTFALLAQADSYTAPERAPGEPLTYLAPRPMRKEHEALYRLRAFLDMLSESRRLPPQVREALAREAYTTARDVTLAEWHLEPEESRARWQRGAEVVALKAQQSLTTWLLAVLDAQPTHVQRGAAEVPPLATHPVHGFGPADASYSEGAESMKRTVMDTISGVLAFWQLGAEEEAALRHVRQQVEGTSMARYWPVPEGFRLLPTELVYSACETVKHRANAREAAAREEAKGAEEGSERWRTARQEEDEQVGRRTAAREVESLLALQALAPVHITDMRSLGEAAKAAFEDEDGEMRERIAAARVLALGAAPPSHRPIVLYVDQRSVNKEKLECAEDILHNLWMEVHVAAALGEKSERPPDVLAEVAKAQALLKSIREEKG